MSSKLCLVLLLGLSACTAAPERYVAEKRTTANGDSANAEGDESDPKNHEQPVSSNDPNDTPMGGESDNPIEMEMPDDGSPPPEIVENEEPAPVLGSAGCGKAAGQETEKYVRKSLPSQDRLYDLYLPKNYDKSKPYRLIFVGHGCDGSIPFHIEEVSKDKAVIVALRAKSSQNTGMPYGNGCFETGPGNASLTELPYFDEVLKEVSSQVCIDDKRIFLGGYSSGSWLTNLLGCTRSNVIRAQGNVAGGLPKVPDTCAGPLAAMFIHDEGDDQNVIGEGQKARDRVLKANACSMENDPYDFDNNPATESTCVKYRGCKEGNPVVWCPTRGKGHSDNKPLSTEGLWQFWSQF